MVVRGGGSGHSGWGTGSRFSGERIELRELAGYALQRWTLTTIEEALGRQATLILPPALRTRKLTVPRYQIGALKVLAEEGRESVDALLTRMLEDLAELNQERLARRVPGLAEAMAWPGGDVAVR
ncbi:MAG TPA: hypothetical protein VF618_21600 [Thermoanaerobaculia bacterium]